MIDLSTLDFAQKERLRHDLVPWAGFLEIINTRPFVEFMQRPEKLICWFTGNQFGKNESIIKHYIMRLLGKHPVEAKNMRPDTRIRTVRFCSETLPMDPDGGDKNTVYPVFKKRWPKSLIRKDVSQRRPVMTLIDPQGGPDIFLEFVSYGQEMQAQAGVQRWSCYIDENCTREFFEEQIPRLLASDGDVVIGMTPALGCVTWQFEDIFEKAGMIYRTPRVRARLKQRFNEDHPEIEITANRTDIAVFMAATDDNPMYDRLVKEMNARELKTIETGKHLLFKSRDEYKPITKKSYIEGKLGFYDEESEDVRRYGIFRQISGRIFKDFDSRIHVLDFEKYFPDYLPHEYTHARAIDYHQSTPWHCTFIALSPEDEAFVYDEVVMSPERYITFQICRQIAEHSKDFRYTLSKIDPLAAQSQTNTGISTIEDINRIFHELKRDNIGTGGYWTTWDTKSTRGREEVRKRIKNARDCGVPFNNRMIVNGREVNLPTIWFSNGCRITIDSMKNWRSDEGASGNRLKTKEPSETPMQKHSHICTAIECLFKEAGFRARTGGYVHMPPSRRTSSQFGMRRSSR